jgi:hypothetical protein
VKKLVDITVDDLRQWPVWEYLPGDVEPFLVPVERLPVVKLDNRLVGSTVVLYNGQRCCAILGNISLENKRSTQHFLTLSIERNGTWFDLARYHDVDYARRGPVQLAMFLKLKTEDVFPITYDISRLAIGLRDIVVGEIPLKPRERLSKSKLIKLALQE